ncbi:hypothetical protein CM49_02945 [Paenibacillus sp. P1XP2]|nr:hypothetical protein CM49_02945 [Paenibacillus sp. P1XP2]
MGMAYQAQTIQYSKVSPVIPAILLQITEIRIFTIPFFPLGTTLFYRIRQEKATYVHFTKKPPLPGEQMYALRKQGGRSPHVRGYFNSYCTLSCVETFTSPGETAVEFAESAAVATDIFASLKITGLLTSPWLTTSTMPSWRLAALAIAPAFRSRWPSLFE